jgi:GMP synthase (glutamine-hydrolysing)
MIGPMPRSHRPRVLAIQHVAVEHPALVGTALESAGVEVALVRVHAGEAIPRSAAGLGGLLIMGGPMSAYEADRRPHLRQELHLIERALARALPVLGICLGSQLLAAALGTRVEKGPGPEIGWLPVTLAPAAASDPLFAPLPNSFTALHWHGDVFDLPRGAAHLACSELTRVQAFRHGPSAYGLLFHAEVTPEQPASWAAAFEAELEEAGVSQDAILRGAREQVAELSRLALPLYGRWAELVKGRA